jgi:hypothetical protein
MTPAQQLRQDMQVKWLREAIAAQNRSPDDETLDKASLSITRKEEPA